MLEEKKFKQKIPFSLAFVSLLFLFSSLLIIYALHVRLPSSKVPICLYSTHQKEDLRLVILRAIQKAKKSIHIHTYCLSDPNILTHLFRKAKKGVEVHMTYDKKGSPSLDRFPFFHLHPKKEKGLMHAKWLVVDEKLILLGTANLTSSSLMMHDNFLMGFYDAKFARALIENQPFYQSQINHQTIRFFLLPNQEGLDTLLETLRQAKKNVRIALFTLTHPLLVDQLIALHKKGIEIFLSIDQNCARGSSKDILERLQKNHLFVRKSQGLKLFHHKWAIIDQSTFILGSANWTLAAFEKNKDFILFLSPLTKKQQKYLYQSIQIIKKETLSTRV